MILHFLAYMYIVPHTFTGQSLHVVKCLIMQLKKPHGSTLASTTKTHILKKQWRLFHQAGFVQPASLHVYLTPRVFVNKHKG